MPRSLSEVETSLEQEKARLEQENRRLKMMSNDRYKFGGIIGKSPAMQAIYELVTKAAASDASITMPETAAMERTKRFLRIVSFLLSTVIAARVIRFRADSFS